MAQKSCQKPICLTSCVSTCGIMLLMRRPRLDSQCAATSRMSPGSAVALQADEEQEDENAEQDEAGRPELPPLLDGGSDQETDQAHTCRCKVCLLAAVSLSIDTHVAHARCVTLRVQAATRSRPSSLACSFPRVRVEGNWDGRFTGPARGVME